MSEEKKQKFLTLKLDQGEIAVRIIEAMTGLDRPDGLTPEECLDAMDKSLHLRSLAAATSVAMYFAEIIKEQVPSTEIVKTFKNDN